MRQAIGRFLHERGFNCMSHSSGLLAPHLGLVTLYGRCSSRALAHASAAVHMIILAVAVTAASFFPISWHLQHQLHPRSRASTPILSSALLTRLTLVHEDERMRKAIGRFLHERGFNCMSHSSGLLALAEMAREPPALVITDSEAVGGMDGYGLLSRIKSDWRLCGVPVVLLTARGLPADRISGYRAGASAYVAAPFDPEELLAVVNAQLTAVHLARAATIHNELQPIKDDIASVKQLLQLLLQGQMQSLQSLAASAANGDAAPKLLRQLESQVVAAEGSAGFNASAGAPGSGALVPRAGLLVPPMKVPKLTNRERTVLEPHRVRVSLAGARGRGVCAHQHLPTHLRCVCCKSKAHQFSLRITFPPLRRRMAVPCLRGLACAADEGAQADEPRAHGARAGGRGAAQQGDRAAARCLEEPHREVRASSSVEDRDEQPHRAGAARTANGAALRPKGEPVSSAYQLASAPPFQMNPAAEMAVGDGAGSDDAGDKPPPTGTAADAT
eukprot:CAMPEP_0119402934 /NCGR_PEP_ID=MMETSP1334-20130426/143132_1 /TAXON_ID=127549 /ORGANISM="Calcidiscus leptoporus, Strain RCC1130" /LENGTH=501 /DNA_ID=CAMNT_0007426873 /DNA_START=304 /DNA_END=1811 /DNA_ORIENTATION=-